jgi:hypothetical protein
MNLTRRDNGAVTPATQAQNEPKRGFNGVWIPASLWKRRDLTWLQKCILAEIDSLERGCFASNAYLAKHMAIPERTLTNNLAVLRKKGLIIDWGFNGRTRQISVADEVSSNPQHTRNRDVCLPGSGYAAYPEAGPIDTSIDTRGWTKETKETPVPSEAGAPRVSAFKRKSLNKEQSRKHLRWPRFEIPSLDEVIQCAEDNGWDKMLSFGREESAYQKLHGDRWHHWNGKRWTVVKDWKSYFSSLNHKMEQH